MWPSFFLVSFFRLISSHLVRPFLFFCFCFSKTQKQNKTTTAIRSYYYLPRERMRSGRQRDGVHDGRGRREQRPRPSAHVSRRRRRRQGCRRYRNGRPQGQERGAAPLCNGVGGRNLADGDVLGDRCGREYNEEQDWGAGRGIIGRSKRSGNASFSSFTRSGAQVVAVARSRTRWWDVYVHV